jgi:hypothetical protein
LPQYRNKERVVGFDSMFETVNKKESQTDLREDEKRNPCLKVDSSSEETPCS